MLEGMTTLGFMAAHSRRARLGLMVGGIHYRQAGLWLKAATTLDVLSGGRAWFGIGAAWNEQESRALGFPMPPLGERFEMLEETLRLVRLGWQGELGSRDRLRGTPLPGEPPAQQPAGAEPAAPAHPHRRRRRAAHAQAGGHVRRRHQRLRHGPGTAGPQVRRPAAPLRDRRPRLRQHREDASDAGRPITPDGARRSLTPGAARGAPGPHDGGRCAARHLQRRDVHDLSKLELIGRDVIPQLRDLGQPSPLP